MADRRYLEIAAAVDADFRRNQALHGERIHCRAGCTDCCHHVFKISQIEAEHVAEGVRRLEAEARTALAERAREYIAAGDAAQRRPCPALRDGVCTIYEHRPLICRRFGMPIFNPDRPERIMACELNFKDGEEIVDPDLVQIQTRIHEVWKPLRSERPRRVSVAEAILEAD